MGKYDALFGKNLHPNHALLSPKIATIIRAPKENLQKTFDDDEVNEIQQMMSEVPAEQNNNNQLEAQPNQVTSIRLDQ